MTHSESPAHDPLPLMGRNSVRKRRVRKGTRSCWECKRRKNKCTWSRGDGDCDGCYHRGTRCVGQELSEEHVPCQKRGAANNRLDEARLRRVESLLDELTRRVNTGNLRRNHEESASDDGNQELPNDTLCQRLDELSNDVLDGDRVTGAQPPPSNLLTVSLLAQTGDATDRLLPLIHALVTVWPSKHHDVILKSNASSLHPALAGACSSFGNSPSPKDLLQLPAPGTAPDDIARKLLMLGTYLQVISSQSKDESAGDLRLVTSRVFDTVNRFITHNDRLPVSVGIIECLIIESQYYNYIGNIHRACITARRAVAMAQIMGLDRRGESLPLNTDADTDEARVSLRQENAWFQLVHLDQYLSLLLGISPGVPQRNQTSPGLLERCTSWEQMGRLHSVAAGRILQRNRIDIYDVNETREIDGILQKAAACVPARWWLAPITDLGTKDPGDSEFSDPTSRLMVQFAHYNILLQLHLPHMLRSLTSPQCYPYSISTVMNSSREILTRFTTFRRYHPAISYCRGLDFFTFVASIALCLLHVHTSCECRVPSCSDNGGISELLAHQRPTSRGLMEQALESIEKISQIELNDNIASDIVPAFRKLLAVEGEAHGGADYDIHLSANVEPMDSDYQTADENDVLCLQLPFCGAVQVKKRWISDCESTETPNSASTSLMRLEMTSDSLPLSTPLYSNEGELSLSVSGLLAPEIMDGFEGRLETSIDMSYLGYFRDM
ncbi:hypothetical protein GGR50DRAFT_682653 [Xylaria sp. CBS 124048]|nr:hypothetical protein GGR50DRAFT_682653 [Xylaria sp. CBS 124048]